MQIRPVLTVLATVSAAMGPAMGQGSVTQRPKILGVAHMALYVSDLEKARAFYKGFLGFEEPFKLGRKDGSGDRIAFIKINEDQYIELFAEAPKKDGQMNHIAFYTDDAKRMRDYLASAGVKVPDSVGKGQVGNLNFNIVDPDGHTVEIVEYAPDGWTRREKGKFLPPSRISERIGHIGVLVGDLAASQRFYRDILGFQETWRGGSQRQLSWVNMKVPDGEDYLEMMLYSRYPERDQVGVKNHICLVTPDIEKAVKSLEARPFRRQYQREIEIKTGVNRRRQANLFDPDGTRIELMEPHTVDGKPAPSSTAPPPAPQKRGMN
jgi:lactoylglutathione lyase